LTQEDFQIHVVDSLARLDAKLESLAGNGQPGRVGKLENQLEDLKAARWTIGGIATGIAITISTIIHFLFK
jgi:hypothetical protein